MLNINTYLHFDGEAEAAMNFYRSILGGDFIRMQRYKDMPGSSKIPPADRDRFIHISLELAGGLVIMASDVMASMETPYTPGNNYHICIQAESEKEADAIFNGLAAGGKTDMPMNKTFWGAYFGMCRDQFGIRWMINCEPR